MRRLATEHPLLFVIAVLLWWLTSSLLASLAAAALLDSELASDLAQSLGTLTATALIVLLAWRLGWLRPAGISRLGGWRVWLVALAIMLYFYAAYRYAFFGTLASDLAYLLRLPEAWGVLLRHLVVGTVEEILFRGILLYALVRAWGTTRRGLFAAIITPALLFGSLHILQLATGNSLSGTLLTIVIGLFSGIWMGALVLRWGTIWPGVAIHALSNAVVNVGALAVPDFAPPTSAFLLAALFEMPLVLLGIWWFLHLPLAGGPASGEPQALEGSRRQIPEGAGTARPTL
jgi:membrane protease YdiL (CAAX protease family)